MNRISPRGGAVLTVILSAFSVLALVIAALVGTGIYLAHNIEVTEDRHGDRVNIETPFGSIHVRKGRVDPKRLGVPVYPGAALRDDHHKMASIELDLGSDHKELVVVAAEYTTPDSVAKVREYYSRELPNWVVVGRRGGGVQIECRDGHYKRLIAVEEKRGLTHIALASVGEPAAN